MLSEEPLQAVRAALGFAARVVVLSGAGVSAESGIATFRDALNRAPKAPAASAPQGGAFASGRPGGEPGHWSRFDPAQLASVDGFRANPTLVWDWYAERRAGVLAAEPNAGHRALGDFARRHPGRLTVVTQNVDNLHQRAGNTDAIRLHGDILADRWLDPCPRQPPCDGRDALPERPPRCAHCGNLRRPGVVWFGEMLPPGAMETAEAAVRSAGLLLVVGTSGAVWPAAGLAGLARRHGATVAIVNPHESELDEQAHFLLRGPSATVLPALFDGV